MQSNPFPPTSDRKSIDALNTLLKGEISAIETYQQAIEKLNDERLYQLKENLDSHSERVSALRHRILELGGEPAKGSGLWGSFAKLMEGSAKIFGKDAAVAALEQGEDIGISDYSKYVRDLDPDSRTLVENELMPAQQRTHRTMSEMKNDGGPRGRSSPTSGGVTLLLVVALGLGSLGLSACHDHNERKTGMKMEEVPPPVRTTITRLAGQDTVADIREERLDGGQLCYHVVVDRNGSDAKYKIDETGSLRE